MNLSSDTHYKSASELSFNPPTWKNIRQIHDRERLNNLKNINLYKPKEHFKIEKKKKDDYDLYLHSDDEEDLVEKLYQQRVREGIMNDAKGIRKNDINVLISNNERKKVNLNTKEGRLLSINNKNLDRQLSNSQLQLKKEQKALLDDIIEARAINQRFTNRKKSISNESNQGSRLNLHNSIEKQIDRLTDRHTEKTLTERSYYTRSVDNFKIETPTPTKPYKSYLEKLSEKFVEQKLNNYPHYLKKSGKMSNSCLVVYDNEKVEGIHRNLNLKMYYFK